MKRIVIIGFLLGIALSLFALGRIAARPGQVESNPTGGLVQPAALQSAPTASPWRELHDATTRWSLQRVGCGCRKAIQRARQGG